MKTFSLWSIFLRLFAVIGLIAVVVVCLLAMPLKEPLMLETIYKGAMSINQEGKPELTHFQARDGTWLAYRLYPASNISNTKIERLAILAHGSSGSSSQMNMIGKALADSGITSVAIDVRGHGASGTRGDISYLGQLEDDLSDLLDELHKIHPTEKVMLIGHSSGGGFALRIAGSSLATKFDRFLLLSPYLGYSAPTNQENESASTWVEVDLPRMVAITLLSQIGIDWLQGMPTIAFANAPNSKKHGTSCYSYRLMINYGPPEDWKEAFLKAAGRIEVIAGKNDELMNSPAFKTALEPLGVKVELLDDVDHMGIVYTQSSLEAIRKAAISP
jgi:pimeloyl-ACP methyl ester carboxylesterase